MNLDVEPIPGDDLQVLIAGLYATPAHLVAQARQALTAKPTTDKPLTDKSLAAKPLIEKPQR